MTHFKNPENNLTTKIKLFLSSGTLFTKATALNSDSDFEVYTADTTAAVRWTIFSISYIGWKTKVSVYKGQVKVQTKSNTPTNLNPITPWTGITINTDRQTQNNTTITAIDTTIKTKLEIFANVIDTKNQPVKIVTYVEPTPQNCDWTLHWNSKDFWNIWNVSFWNSCPSSESFTCNNWVWENSNWRNKSSYTYNSCSVWPANNCWWGQLIRWTHIYTISPLNHNENKSFFIRINENNWEFRYYINAKCNNWSVTYDPETWPTVISCNTGYKKESNSCVIDTPPWNFFDWNTEIPNQDDPKIINSSVKITYKDGTTETLYVTKIKNSLTEWWVIKEIKLYSTPNRIIKTNIIENIEILENTIFSWYWCDNCPWDNPTLKKWTFYTASTKHCRNIINEPKCQAQRWPWDWYSHLKYNWSWVRK